MEYLSIRTRIIIIAITLTRISTFSPHPQSTIPTHQPPSPPPPQLILSSNLNHIVDYTIIHPLLWPPPLHTITTFVNNQSHPFKPTNHNTYTNSPFPWIALGPNQHTPISRVRTLNFPSYQYGIRTPNHSGLDIIVSLANLGCKLSVPNQHGTISIQYTMDSICI